MIAEERPPYFVYNARPRFNRTSCIPFSAHTGLINLRVAAHSSLRALYKRMILNPAVLPVERHSCPVSSSVLATMKKYGLTVRRYA